MKAIGKRCWVIPEGYLPPPTPGASRALQSHEAACILNAGDRDAHVEITVYFADRDPAGPYRLTVGAERCFHLRFNDLENPAPVPVDTPYSSVIRADVPVIVQHTRLDARQPNLALLSTMAYAVEESHDAG